MSDRDLLLAAIKKSVPKVTFGLGHRKGEFVSTGSMSLDHALGTGGFPRGGIVEVSGAESSGKTVIVHSALVQYQKLGHLGAYINTETPVPTDYQRELGVDLDKLIMPDSEEPLCGEQYLDIALTCAADPQVGLVVIDSIAAAVPKAELEGEMEDNHMAVQARMTSKFLRKVNGILSHSGNTLLIVNQLRNKVGLVFGNPEDTPCGRALKFYCGQRVSIRRGETVKSRGLTIGMNVKNTVIKNKYAAPYGKGEFVLIYGKGIDSAREVLDLAVRGDIVTKAGNWYSFEGERLAMGYENAADKVRESEELKNKILEKLIPYLKDHPETFGKPDE